MSSEESIYKIMEAFEDKQAEERQLKLQRTKILMERKPIFVLPTASTFINHSSARPGVCNMGGIKDPNAVLQTHKASHATMGLPKSAYQKRNQSNHKRSNWQTLPVIHKFDYKKDVPTKPPVPSI